MTIKVPINKEGANEKRKCKKRFKRKTKIQKIIIMGNEKNRRKKDMTKRHSEEKKKIIALGNCSDDFSTFVPGLHKSRPSNRLTARYHIFFKNWYRHMQGN